MPVMMLASLENAGQTCTAMAYEWARRVFINESADKESLMSTSREIKKSHARLKAYDWNPIFQAQKAGFKTRILQQSSSISPTEVVVEFEKSRKKYGRAVGLVWYEKHTMGYADITADGLGNIQVFMDANRGIWMSDNIDDMERFLKKTTAQDKVDYKVGTLKGYMIFGERPPPPPSEAIGA